MVRGQTNQIGSSDNVGIGTTSPAAPLDVLKTSGDAIQIKTADANPTRLDFGTTGSIWYATATRSGSGTFLPFTIWTADNERFRIDTSGKGHRGFAARERCPPRKATAIGGDSMKIEVPRPQAAKTGRRSRTGPLTLHQIAQEKLLKAQQAEIAALRQQLSALTNNP
jgi:hypothetical protein